MALADIEDRHYITGFSPSLRVRQRIDSRCLANLYAFALAFYLRFGYPIIISEGARTRVRQKYLRQLYEAYLRGGPWAALAAILYTSRHDEVNNPNAIDFGSGIASSQTSASKWAHENGPKYGISFTISTEPWHGEISYSTTSTAGRAGGTPLPVDAEDEDDMGRRIRVRSANGTIAIWDGGPLFYELPGPADEKLIDGWKLWERGENNKYDLNLSDEVFQLVKTMALQARGSSISPTDIWSHELVSAGGTPGPARNWLVNMSDAIGRIEAGLESKGFTAEEITVIAGEIGRHVQPGATPAAIASAVADESDKRTVARYTA